MKILKAVKRVIAFVLSMLIALSAFSVIDIESGAVDAHTHIYDGNWEVTIKPTCKTAGYGYTVCTVTGCNYRYSDVIPVMPNAHNYVQTSVKKAATCKLPGIDYVECTVCGDKAEVNVEPLTHQFDEDKWQVIKKPVHNTAGVENGREKNTCLLCNKLVIRDIVVEHTINTTVPPRELSKSTCSTEGAMLYSCTQCSEPVIVSVELDSNNHVFTERAFEVTGLTCKQDGIGKFICKGCGITKEEVIDKSLAHEYLDWEVETPLPEGADCSSRVNNIHGVMVRKCKVSGEIVERKRIDPPHIIEEPLSKVEPTCVREGRQYGYCIVCLANVDDKLAIDENNHIWDIVVLKEATCTEEGRIVKICSLDESHVVYEDVDKLEHKLKSNWTIIKEANCSEEGSRHSYCSDCGYVNEIIPVSEDAHIFAPDVKWEIDPDNKPTCYNIGKERAKCIKCDNYVYRDVPKHTGNLVSYSYTAPTCLTTGKMSYTCLECNREIDEIIPIDKDAHVRSINMHPVLQPTCHSEGMEAYTCDCGYVFTGQGDYKSVKPSAHTVSDWVITVRPTCEKPGVKTRKCTNADCDFVEVKELSESHNYSTWLVTEEATCTKRGTRTRYCYTCGAEESETFIGAHVPGQWAKEKDANGNLKKFDCMTGGTAYLFCANCNEKFDVKTVKPGEHVNLVLLEKKYTQTEESCYSELHQCTACGISYKNLLPHMWKEITPEIEPDCVNGGITSEKFCYICFYNSPAKEIDPLGHTFQYDDDGTKYCTKCPYYSVEDGVLDACTHFCHNKGTIMKVLKKIFSFFWKFLGTNHFCECGNPHYHEGACEIISTKIEDGKIVSIVYSCTECKVKNKTIKF